MHGETTLTEFIMREQLRFPRATGDFLALLHYVQLACKRISSLVGQGLLVGADSARTVARYIFFQTNEYSGLLASMLPGDADEPSAVPDRYPRGHYLLVFDALDSASDIDINVPAGSVFSILRCPEGEHPASAAAFQQTGRQLLCAGYAIYGPTTMLMITVGRGTHGFTLDRGFGEFVLTHPDLRIPAETRELAVNVSSEPYWEQPVRRYVAERVAGRSGPRGEDFTMRWIASLVAEVHRILIRGGLFLSPVDSRNPTEPGRLRLLHEAAPMAMLIEQAGGAASTGHEQLLDVKPHSIRQRIPVILGSRSEVERIERYHREHDAGIDEPFVSPLFNERSLYNRS